MSKNGQNKRSVPSKFILMVCLMSLRTLMKFEVTKHSWLQSYVQVRNIETCRCDIADTDADARASRIARHTLYRGA